MLRELDFYKRKDNPDFKSAFHEKKARKGMKKVVGEKWRWKIAID